MPTDIHRFGRSLGIPENRADVKSALIVLTLRLAPQNWPILVEEVTEMEILSVEKMRRQKSAEEPPKRMMVKILCSVLFL